MLHSIMQMFSHLSGTTHYFSTSNRRHEKKEGGKGKTPEEDEGIFRIFETVV